MGDNKCRCPLELIILAILQCRSATCNIAYSDILHFLSAEVLHVFCAFPLILKIQMNNVLIAVITWCNATKYTIYLPPLFYANEPVN